MFWHAIQAKLIGTTSDQFQFSNVFIELNNILDPFYCKLELASSVAIPLQPSRRINAHFEMSPDTIKKNSEQLRKMKTKRQFYDSGNNDTRLWTMTSKILLRKSSPSQQAIKWKDK